MNYVNNTEANWKHNEYYYDDKGNAHRWYIDINNTSAYELEDGTLEDDVHALLNGFILIEDDEVEHE